jgi:hypothetical protein
MLLGSPNIGIKVLHMRFESWDREVVAAWVGTDVATGRVPTVPSISVECLFHRDDIILIGVAMRDIESLQLCDRELHRNGLYTHQFKILAQTPGGKTRTKLIKYTHGMFDASVLVTWPVLASAIDEQEQQGVSASTKVKLLTWGSTFFCDALSLQYGTKNLLLKKQQTVKAWQD